MAYAVIAPAVAGLALRLEGSQGPQPTGHTVHVGHSGFPIILVAILVVVIACVVFYAVRRLQKRRQAGEPDVWKRDTSRRG